MGGEFLPNINYEKHDVLDHVSDRGIVVALDEETEEWTDAAAIIVRFLFDSYQHFFAS